MNLTGMDKAYLLATVEPSQSVEGYWTVVRAGEVLLITRDRDEATAVCQKLQETGGKTDPALDGAECSSRSSERSFHDAH